MRLFAVPEKKFQMTKKFDVINIPNIGKKLYLKEWFLFSFLLIRKL